MAYSSKFKKNLKRILKQGKDIEKLKTVLEAIANKKILRLNYKDHALSTDKKFKNCTECHIEPDWLLIYKYNNDKLILLLVKTRSHSELFNK